MSQSSVVQTPVKAMGTKSRTMLVDPISSLSLTIFGPSAVLVTRVKSGAWSPILIDMMLLLVVGKVVMLSGRSLGSTVERGGFGLGFQHSGVMILYAYVSGSVTLGIR